MPPVSQGADVLWGLDGPVHNRLGLAWGVSDRIMLTLQRSSLQDNLDLNVKGRLAEGGAGATPWMLGGLVGGAWSTEVPGRDGGDARNRQLYVQGIGNVLVGSRLALGLVPWWLHNPRIEDEASDDALGVGLMAQLYLRPGFSLLAEWSVSESREELEHDAGSLGFELETGGHFFKILISNSPRLNPGQFLPGTHFSFEPDEWKLGFNITRVLVF